MENELKSMEMMAKMSSTPEGKAGGVKFVEAAWRAAGLEPDQPTKEFADMMKIVKHFQD